DRRHPRADRRARPGADAVSGHASLNPDTPETGHARDRPAGTDTAWESGGWRLLERHRAVHHGSVLQERHLLDLRGQQFGPVLPDPGLGVALGGIGGVLALDRHDRLNLGACRVLI